jgi:hypothetical protein
MNQRDKQIIDNLMRFRVMTRDDIMGIHFSEWKNPVKQANAVLKRLRRDKQIDCCTKERIYRYFPIPSIKRESQKIPHFLAIVSFYRELRKHEEPRTFDVEPKYGKGSPEPDAFVIWKGAPFYVEIQRKQYTAKEMKDKTNRYEQYYYSEEWKKEPWQPVDKKLFPLVWMITETRYNLTAPFKTIQSKDVDEFLAAAVRKFT